MIICSKCNVTLNYTLMAPIQHNFLSKRCLNSQRKKFAIIVCWCLIVFLIKIFLGFSLHHIFHVLGRIDHMNGPLAYILARLSVLHSNSFHFSYSCILTEKKTTSVSPIDERKIGYWKNEVLRPPSVPFLRREV